MSGTLPEYDKIVRWTINDVNQWLTVNSFAEFGKSFREAGVDGAKFVNLEQVNFNQMRSPMNKRGKLLDIIKSIRKPERVTNKVNEIQAPRPSPAAPPKDYGSKQKFPNDNWNDNGSASGSDDDYEWNADDFDSDDQDGGHDDSRKSRANLSKPGQSGYRNQQADDDGSDSQDDYENLAENGMPIPPVPNRGLKHQDQGSIMDKLKDALNQRGNTLPKNQAPVSQNSEDEDSNSDYENPVEEPKTPPRRKAEPAQPPIPSRPGRNHAAPKKSEIELPAYEESVPSEEQQVYDEPEKDAPPPVPPSNRSRGHPGSRPQLAVPGRQQDTPPRPPPGKSRGRKEPAPEPEETYEVPEDLPPAPAPPVEDDQAVYEDPDEPPPPARPPAKSMNLPPRPGKSAPDPRQDSNKPQVPPPRSKNRRQQPVPTEEAAGYMEMRTAPQPPAGVEPEDDYLGPDDLNQSDPSPKEKKMLNLPGFKPPPPEETTTPPREVPPPPRGNKGSRPLPPKPSPAPEPEDPLEAYNWYQASMNREEGERRLKQHSSNGMYLIRKSKGGGDRPYTLMIFNDNSVFNLPIRCRPDGRYAMGKEKRNEQTFSDLSEMVEFFSKRTIILAATSGGQTRLKSPLPS